MAMFSEGKYLTIQCGRVLTISMLKGSTELFESDYILSANFCGACGQHAVQQRLVLTALAAMLLVSAAHFGHQVGALVESGRDEIDASQDFVPGHG